MKVTSSLSHKAATQSSAFSESSFPWPIPQEGAEVEAASYRREATASRNAIERLFIIRICVRLSADVRYIHFESGWRERDCVTGRVPHSFLYPVPFIGENYVEVISPKRTRNLPSLVVTTKEMKARKTPAILETLFAGFVGRSREFMERERNKYERNRAASEERGGGGCF